MTSGFIALQVLGGDLQAAQRLLLFFANVAYWTSWSALALLVLGLARRHPLTGHHRWRALAIHAAASLLFVFVHMPVVNVLNGLARAVVLDAPFDLSLVVRDVRWLTRWQVEWEVTMYWALVGLGHALAFREEGRARALLAARLDAELSQAKFQALQQQMHPHFLFNTLQSISVLIHRDPDAAEEMVARLGDLLRGSLRRQSSALVSLDRELQYVSHYVAIEQMNLGDRLRIVLQIEPEARGCQVPELLLQPLVENAIRHGIAPAVAGGTVRISATRQGNRLLIEVSDDGVGPGKGVPGSGIALGNTRRRLELLYPGTHEITLTPGVDGRGMHVAVTLPQGADQAVA